MMVLMLRAPPVMELEALPMKGLLLLIFPMWLTELEAPSVMRVLMGALSLLSRCS